MYMRDCFKTFLSTRPAPLLCIGVVALAGIAGAFAAGKWHATHVPSINRIDTPVSALPSLPGVLTAHEAATYRYIFNAQKAGDWKAANAKLAEVQDTLLLGHVQAQRYLSHSYKPASQELSGWLATYSDHPQAYELSKVAVAHAVRAPALAPHPTLSGYGDDNGLARTSEDPILANAALHLYNGAPGEAYKLAIHSQLPAAHWIAGLAAWRVRDINAAARHFSLMADSDTGLSPWEKSASAFWAYRAFDAKGEHGKASRYLEMAASHPRTFYGIMARKALGRPLDINADVPPSLDGTSLTALYANPVIKRAVALVQAGQNDLAEAELRALFPTQDRPMRVKLLSLAYTLNLPAAEISMAKALKRQGVSYDIALYPTPAWQPDGGFVVDSALVFALTRQESGFRADAKSGAGALGLMQLMPQTASHMQARTAPGQAQNDLFNPTANLALGQTYVNYLMSDTAASSNLIFLTASYNAGPGKLAEWTKTLDYRGDPLLFLESIPFAQTRNYVSQVLTSYWIYSELQGKVAVSALSLAEGKWPLYDQSLSASLLQRRAAAKEAPAS